MKIKILGSFSSAKVLAFWKNMENDSYKKHYKMVFGNMFTKMLLCHSHLFRLCKQKTSLIPNIK